MLGTFTTQVLTENLGEVDLVDEQDNPIGLDRSSEFGKDDFYTINQLHVPVDKKIRVDLSSKDVIHNFKLPELRVSQDAIPGMVIPVHFTATSTSEEFLETAVGTMREGKSLELHALSSVVSDIIA